MTLSFLRILFGCGRISTQGVFIKVAGLALLCALSSPAIDLPVDATGLGYTNFRVADIPWSIHVVEVPRTNNLYEIHSVHAGKAAVGLDTLSEQVALVESPTSQAVAAINGDFYQRDRAFAGAPRGLQIIDGELIHGPGSDTSFWIDAQGEAHASNVQSLFHITWPDGTSTPFSLNSERYPNRIELYTPAMGRSTRAYAGRELILERAEGSPWLPLRIGKTYVTTVKEVRERGDSPLPANSLVLSIGPGALRGVPDVTNGAVLRIFTTSDPALHGVKTAMGGGPVIVHNGRLQKPPGGSDENYEHSSMFERHPRAAIGWNQNAFFLVEVDGRQRSLSVGMTLQELGRFMVSLGCQEAMNFDGGGSATLWFRGEVRNSPCERAEREIANCLVITKEKRDSPIKGSSR
ncbi:MAG TPA: phosphodiester glycosidase family protein [Verrucomicrobiae bacterium]|nr:phosphodiester glycosidase family protein [Verrucomicrobiae bacterium]